LLLLRQHGALSERHPARKAADGARNHPERGAPDQMTALYAGRGGAILIFGHVDLPDGWTGRNLNNVKLSIQTNLNSVKLIMPKKASLVVAAKRNRAEPESGY